MSRPDDEQSLARQPERVDERSLVVRSEQTSLEGLKGDPFLQRAGFSPQLPERLLRLNDVLFKPPIESIGIELIPGTTPLITTHVEHGREGILFF